jgi:hypothetical protein
LHGVCVQPQTSMLARSAVMSWKATQVVVGIAALHSHWSTAAYAGPSGPQLSHSASARGVPAVRIGAARCSRNLR